MFLSVLFRKPEKTFPIKVFCIALQSCIFLIATLISIVKKVLESKNQTCNGCGVVLLVPSLNLVLHKSRFSEFYVGKQLKRFDNFD